VWLSSIFPRGQRACDQQNLPRSFFLHNSLLGSPVHEGLIDVADGFPRSRFFGCRPISRPLRGRSLSEELQLFPLPPLPPIGGESLESVSPKFQTPC